MKGPFVRLELIEHVALVRIDRPPVNALSRTVLFELAETIASLATELPGALVLTGGPLFSAGADVTELADPGGAVELIDAFAKACDALASFPRATVAALSSFTLGGGLELALACDFRFASPTTVIGFPEVSLGLLPGAGGTQRLTLLVGPARAKRLIFTAEQIDAEEARELGIVDDLFADVLQAALSFAKRLTHGDVEAQSLAKRAIDSAGSSLLSAGLDIERDLFHQALERPQAVTAITRFLERRNRER